MMAVMDIRTFEVEVQNDHLQQIAQTRRPYLALAELIWNSLDADADYVRVTVRGDNLGGLKSITVADDGHGIPYDEAEGLFKRLGGSWKARARHSKEKRRVLHGREGRGRFRAFALGRVVDWDIRYHKLDQLMQYRISMLKDQLRSVTVYPETPAPTGTKRGVVVTVSELDTPFRTLNESQTVAELAWIFALYLRQYPKVEIHFGGRRVDPSAAIELVTSYELPPLAKDENLLSLSLEIVEWRIQAPRRIYFCDAAGFPVDDVSPGIQAPGFEFTAYLKSQYFGDLVASNTIDLASMDPTVDRALNAAKTTLRDHFRLRAKEKASGLVREWQAAGIYPYEDEPTDPINAAERQVFDVVALNVNSYHPTFAEADQTTKSFQLRLLRQAIENAPQDLSRILTEVLDLPSDRRKELVELLDRTTLTSVIGASKTVSDRINFLRGLEVLVFEDGIKERVRERSQLHRVLAENAWMFGEQYSLSVDDQSLTEVLRKHLRLQKRAQEVTTDVVRPDGRKGIVDLMFSRNIARVGLSDREHLVVELKRPTVKIDADAANQIESYAISVASDERFRDGKARWEFWAVSSDIDEHVRRKINQAGRRSGILYQDELENITIWVKTWGQLIDECKGRLSFFQERLQYVPDRDSSMKHLQHTYSKYLGDLFGSPSVEGQTLAGNLAVKITSNEIGETESIIDKSHNEEGTY